MRIKYSTVQYSTVVASVQSYRLNVYTPRSRFKLTLLSVLDELNTDTLADSRVRLLGLNTDLLENDALGVG